MLQIAPQSAAAPQIYSNANSVKSKPGRGGKRPGAGRKPNIAKRLLKGFTRDTIGILPIMDGNPKPSRPLFIELRFTDCPHVLRWQGWKLVHGSDCSKHCYICMPELREKPIQGKCPDCSVRDREQARRC